ncbi:MAG: hypothetical protein E4H41_10290 [Gemmatimonadales bacterium]|jgi:hypothetical protein|nr:MAG: hypothetical protein E4H41_10290 [Gemmatimonadales bacterium]
MLRCVLAWMSWSRTSSASDRSRANQPVGASALMTTVDTSTSSPVNEALKTGPRRQATGIRSLSPEGLSSGMDRPTPFDLVFSGLAPDHFPPIRDALVAANADLADRDAFLLTHPAMTLLREFRPDDTEAGNGLDELTALVHHAYVFWASGRTVWSVPAPELRRLLSESEAAAVAPPGPGYIQFPERLIWASLTSPGPWEPLDGCFVHTGPDGQLHVLGVFGVHAARDGFTVAEARGTPGQGVTRRDGTALFAPTLDGGALAGLHSLVEPTELVELVARVLAHPALASVQLEDA